jgi:hypothetical protein
VQRIHLLLATLVLAAIPLQASITFEREGDPRKPAFSLSATREPLSAIAREITRQTGLTVRIDERANQVISLRIRARSHAELIRYVAAAARRSWSLESGVARIGGRAEPLVDLDVKDAEVRPVLETLRQQCGIRNLVIDPDVQGGSATFLFDGVPCEAAMRAVLHTYALDAISESDTLVGVRTRR